MTTARGSAPFFNEIFRNAVLRGKEIIDIATETLTQAGYPPLTEPITLKVLNAMGQEEAEATLRAELRRTTQLDPITGEPIPDRETIKLITAYIKEGAPYG